MFYSQYSNYLISSSWTCLLDARQLCGLSFTSVQFVLKWSAQKVVERFHRDESKAAREDVAERVFLFAEGSIEVTFHLEDYRIVPIRRTFVKPKMLPDGQRAENWSPRMVTGYQVPSKEIHHGETGWNTNHTPIVYIDHTSTRLLCCHRCKWKTY